MVQQKDEVPKHVRLMGAKMPAFDHSTKFQRHSFKVVLEC
jgi:hypothetical protein